MGKPRPRNGPPSTQPGSKAGKLPKFRKQKRQQQEGEDNARRKTRSVWGLAGLFVGLASLLTYVVGTQRKQKRTRDRHILTNMLRRPLVYTEHAACRMECRFIGKAEVLEAFTHGSINDRKSRPRLQPCPKYVVDASVGPRSKNVQAVFSACPAATNVVTVIDRDTNWACPPC